MLIQLLISDDLKLKNIYDILILFKRYFNLIFYMFYF